MKQWSSTIVGEACSGSSTPPMPAPPERWQCLPTCAQEPTVAQVSTIVPSPTHAPMLTKLGISTTSLPTWQPRRAIAPGTTRTPSLRNFASSKPAKRAGTLSQNGAGSASTSCIDCVRKYSSTAFFSHSLTVQPPLPSGSATRNSPRSRPSSTRSTVGLVEPSISSGVSIARRSQALSMVNFNSSTPGPAGTAFFAATFFFAGFFATGLRVGLMRAFLRRCARSARRAMPAPLPRTAGGPVRR